ncbi:MAG: exosortase system-associated protein, TIGR04073 family [Candidatus Omnitrophica bacterium]|nr:exosortase system-associated protein, TIGR04073 family [Candidatus Omnitrophota bacterium]
MKTCVLIILAVTILASTAFASEVLYHGDTYCERASYKLGRGLSNIVHSNTEIWHNWHAGYVDYGFCGAQVGIVQGLCKMMGRIVLGMTDVVTFPITAGVENYPIQPEIPSYY